MKNFLDQNGLGHVLLSLKQQERNNLSAVTVITAEGTTNQLTIWIGAEGTEPENLPNGTLKLYLKQ